MEISTREIDETFEIICNGKLNSNDEYISFKTALKPHEKANIIFLNANTIDSQILGYLLKCKDEKSINIVVSNARLYDFLQRIEFHNFFSIKIKEYV